MNTLLITGGCGFVGSNLASEALHRQINLIVLDNLSRFGSRENLSWLQSLGKFTFIEGDIRESEVLENSIRKYQPDAVFHLAGQVAMTTSLEDPLLDFEINAKGTLHVLEAIRKHSPETPILYSSSNKVYGDFQELVFEEEKSRYVCPNWPDGFDETMQLNFHSPYGCSKGCADQYLLDYARVFGLKTVVFRHSSMYGSRQFATADQGWVGWFIQQAIETSIDSERPPFTISGTGKQVRDLLHADDVIRLYYSACEHIDQVSGEAYNIGGGVQNSLSLLELFTFLNNELHINLSYTQTDWRLSDQRVFIANLEKIQSSLHWQPTVDYRDGIRSMITWMQEMLCPAK